MLSEVTVKGRVINLGRNALTSFPLAYSINEGELVNETFYRKIDPGDTVDVAFTQKCSLLKDIPYHIHIFSRLPEDGYAGNDTAFVSFVISGTGPEINEDQVILHPNPFNEDFSLEVDFGEVRRQALNCLMLREGSSCSQRLSCRPAGTGFRSIAGTLDLVSIPFGSHTGAGASR